MKRLRQILILASVLTVAAAGLGFTKNRWMNAMNRTPVDLSLVQDGTYGGHSETKLVKVDVQVSVAGGSLTDVTIVHHQCGKGKKANALAAKMVQENTPEVDGVSGATMSSEVIKDAVRNALRNGISR